MWNNVVAKDGRLVQLVRAPALQFSAQSEQGGAGGAKDLFHQHLALLETLRDPYCIFVRLRQFVPDMWGHLWGGREHSRQQGWLECQFLSRLRAAVLSGRFQVGCSFSQIFGKTRISLSQNAIDQSFERQPQSLWPSCG